jgi:hypothetical protein
MGRHVACHAGVEIPDTWTPPRPFMNLVHLRYVLSTRFCFVHSLNVRKAPLEKRKAHAGIENCGAVLYELTRSSRPDVAARGSARMYDVFDIGVQTCVVQLA